MPISPGGDVFLCFLLFDFIGFWPIFFSCFIIFFLFQIIVKIWKYNVDCVSDGNWGKPKNLIFDFLVELSQCINCFAFWLLIFKIFILYEICLKLYVCVLVVKWISLTMVCCDIIVDLMLLCSKQYTHLMRVVMIFLCLLMFIFV